MHRNWARVGDMLLMAVVGAGALAFGAWLLGLNFGWVNY